MRASGWLRSSPGAAIRPWWSSPGCGKGSAALAQLRERLLARAQELSASLDPGRLEQEMLLLAQRLDVAEELDRLGIHIDEVKRLLAARQPIGRRLDFLLQEMHREANTTASKSVHPDTSGAAIELKVLISRSRTGPEY